MKVSTKAAARLSRYREVLHRMKTYGSRWVYSCDLAAAMGSTAAQVRKDFSMLKFAGKKKQGYEVDALRTNLDNALMKDKRHSVIVAGVNPMALCMLTMQPLAENNFNVLALFDVDPDPALRAQLPESIQILPLTSLVDFVTANKVTMGIIAAMDGTAQRLLDLMALAGIRAMVSMAPHDIKAPRNCVVNTVNLVRELENAAFLASIGHVRKARRAK
jgi:redox-sensing transcriptional repressor